MRIIKTTSLSVYLLLSLLLITTAQADSRFDNRPPPYFMKDNQDAVLMSNELKLLKESESAPIRTFDPKNPPYEYILAKQRREEREKRAKERGQPHRVKTLPQNTQITQSYREPENLSIRVIGLAEGMVMLQVNRKPYNLRNGESTPHGIKLIQADSEDAILEINGKKQKYGLNSGIQTSQISLAGGGNQGKKRLHFYKNKEGFYVVNGFIDGVPVKFDVHSNLRAPIILHSDTANQLGIEYKHGIRVDKKVSRHHKKIFKIFLKNITLKNQRFYNVEAWVYENRRRKQKTIPVSKELFKQFHVSYSGYNGMFRE